MKRFGTAFDILLVLAGAYSAYFWLRVFGII